MIASSGKANLAFATTSSEPWSPKGNDSKCEIYYKFPYKVKIARFAFSAGKEDVTVSFKVIGKVHCAR